MLETDSAMDVSALRRPLSTMAAGGGGSLITGGSVLCGWKAARGRFSTVSIVPALR